MQDNDNPITMQEIMQILNITRYTTTIALTALRIQGTSPSNDRRRVEYPPGTISKVREWLRQQGIKA